MQVTNPTELLGYALFRAAEDIDKRMAGVDAVPVLAQILARLEFVHEETIQSLRRGAGEYFLATEHDRLLDLRPDPLAIVSFPEDAPEETEAMAGTLADARSWIFEERKRRAEAGKKQLLYAVEDTRIPVEFRDPLLEIDAEGIEKIHPSIETSGFSLLQAPPPLTR